MKGKDDFSVYVLQTRGAQQKGFCIAKYITFFDLSTGVHPFIPYHSDRCANMLSLGICAKRRQKLSSVTSRYNTHIL